MVDSEVHANLFAESETVPLEELLAALGRPADKTTTVGVEFEDGHPGRYRFNSWSLRAPRVDGEHFGLESLTAWIEGLDFELAERLSRLVEAGVSVGLNIVQTVGGADPIDDQIWAQNFTLTRAAMRWLVAAGAEVGIDQYFLVPE